jgi:hypothetical protein
MTFLSLHIVGIQCKKSGKIMNVKSLLLAAAVVASVASLTSNASANNFFETVAETQVAQAPNRSARVATDAGYMARSDIPTAAKADAATRSRAQVRAETISARNSADARAARDLYLGGAQ